MQKKKNIALFFGSFNPIHIGHLIIAERIAYTAPIDEVWLVVSPQNPFKTKASLLNQYDRLHLVKLGIDKNPKVKASDIEFSLPQPSYTIDTLTYLKEKYPTYAFTLIMGEDNLQHFEKWKNYEQILKHHSLIVYPRKGYETDLYQGHPKVMRLHVPFIDLSASYIRALIKEGKSIRYLLPEAVYQYLKGTNWYQN